MLKIRLARVGRKGDVSYRVVVSEARSKRDSKNLAVIGFYDPLTSPPTFKIDNPKYQNWLQKGAQPTKTVKRLLKNERSR